MPFILSDKRRTGATAIPTRGINPTEAVGALSADPRHLYRLPCAVNMGEVARVHFILTYFS